MINLLFPVHVVLCNCIFYGWIFSLLFRKTFVFFEDNLSIEEAKYTIGRGVFSSSVLIRDEVTGGNMLK